jgi:NAD(P)-dependent dehydrogenase (short-subunit alcohol dehydrogenase family)
VVAAARNDVALGTLTEAIERAGGRAEAVVTDVTDYGAVEGLADRAIGRFGRIDTWINNAAVSVYAGVDELQPDEMDRVVRVDLLGQMYGSGRA